MMIKSQGKWKSRWKVKRMITSKLWWPQYDDDNEQENVPEDKENQDEEWQIKSAYPQLQLQITPNLK